MHEPDGDTQSPNSAASRGNAQLFDMLEEFHQPVVEPGGIGVPGLDGLDGSRRFIEPPGLDQRRSWPRLQVGLSKLGLP